MHAHLRCALALAALPFLVGCLTSTELTRHDLATSPAANATDIDVDGDGALETQGAAAVKEAAARQPPVKQAAWPARASTTVDVSSFRFARPDLVQIGFTNGVLVDLDLATNKPRIRKIQGPPAPIIKISMTGRWVVVNSHPPRLIDVDKGEVLMELTRVDSISATTFAADDSRWYVSSQDGKLRVWNRNKLVATVAGDDVRSVLERQQADLTAALGALHEPLIAAGPSTLFFGDETGDLMMWDVAGQDIDTLMSLESPLRSMAYNGILLAATTQDGRLRVLDYTAGRLLAWTTYGHGTLVALSSTGPERVAVEHEGVITLHDARSGDALWAVELPKGEPCGLGLAAGDGPVAVCVAGQVGILEGKTGALRSVARQVGTKLIWP